MIEPPLTNSSPDASRRTLAASALHAVRTCGPVPVSKEDAAFYDYWKTEIIRFEAQ
jgi:hypothetical protein